MEDIINFAIGCTIYKFTQLYNFGRASNFSLFDLMNYLNTKEVYELVDMIIKELESKNKNVFLNYNYTRCDLI